MKTRFTRPCTAKPIGDSTLSIVGIGTVAPARISKKDQWANTRPELVAQQRIPQAHAHAGAMPEPQCDLSQAFQHVTTPPTLAQVNAGVMCRALTISLLRTEIVTCCIPGVVALGAQNPAVSRPHRC